MILKSINLKQKTMKLQQLHYVFSKVFSVDNMEKTGFHEYVYDFSDDYDNIAVDDILDIHKYFMKNQ